MGYSLRWFRSRRGLVGRGREWVFIFDLFSVLWEGLGKKKKLQIQTLGKSRHEVRTQADTSTKGKGT